MSEARDRIRDNAAFSRIARSAETLKSVLVPALLLLAIVAIGCSTASAEPFLGTELTARNPAAPFKLSDQFGNPIELSSIANEVVLLTFLYTNCPDVCPITTSQLRDAHELLGETAQDVAFVAISVDPERDSVESARQYSEKWKMTDNWSFLVGTEDELKPIWKAYFLDPSIIESSREHPSGDSSSLPAQHGSVAGLREDVRERYVVSHSAPVYLLDKDRAMRVVFTLPFETENLVHDIGLLLD